MPATTLRVRRGFTLIEILVVIGIIAVLAAIVLVAGGRVLASGKKNATQDVLRMLDTALEAYISSKDGLPAATVNTAVDAAGSTVRLVPVADITTVNSVGLFVLQASDVPAAKTQIDGIPQKFLKSAPLGTYAAAANRQLVTPVDAWGRNIRFVMPGFDGVISEAGNPALGVSLDSPRFPQRKTSEQWAFPTLLRTNVAGSTNSDGGVCIGKRPYFYSAGEDGDPSTIEDNVYTTIPTITRN
jgi:prepilin-type N-terminal cleavage/methylation domain-containing protein